jgi:uncharacterized protein YjiS (DUF1127 family)
MADIALDELTDRCAPARKDVTPTPTGTLVVLARRWMKARRDCASLQMLDRHGRRDIGLTAEQVQAAYRTPWWRWPLT